jgi:hypothetical protein
MYSVNDEWTVNPADPSNAKIEYHGFFYWVFSDRSRQRQRNHCAGYPSETVIFQGMQLKNSIKNITIRYCEISEN